MLDWVIVRLLFIVILFFVSYYLRPFGMEQQMAGLVGLGIGAAILLFEMRLNRASLKRLIGAAVGSILGIIGAYIMTLVLGQLTTPQNQNTLSFLQVLLLLLMTYIGLMVGASKGDMLNLAALGGLFGSEKSSKRAYRILDTSVIIDGRISDICATGFLDGILVIPQFVLRELQQVADSADSLKRNRGRRGLDILQKIQKMASLSVQIVDQDFPHVRDVDMKLIELA